MKKILLAILLSIFYFSAVAQNQTVAVFKPNKHNFGTVDKRATKFIETTFRITNPNETPLVIYKIDVSCGCISPDFSKKPIKKGETGYVKLRLDVNQLAGSFNKTAFVKTNSTKDKGVLLLRVTGFAK